MDDLLPSNHGSEWYSYSKYRTSVEARASLFRPLAHDLEVKIQSESTWLWFLEKEHLERVTPT